ncbi:serine hydrolase domain-containing protein [Hyphococcus sp.]|jgi:CubicO group peptidase (beta-lactamase class C family)|uniref:serine hydrolase domain-containing protein n=1 Tax=Hyphococcus sp. TaxID=2038636 RepID=UPI003D0A72D7
MRFALFAGIAALSAAPAHADERDAASYNAEKGGVSMVVMKGGRLAFEDYPNKGGRDKAYELASGTKSFSGAIAAAAVMDGFLSLDERAADTLSEWRDDPQKSQITIRHLLTLTSGVEGGGVFRPPSYAEAIARPMTHAPGTYFEYGPVNFQIFGEIMRRKLQNVEGGKYADAVDYLQARILDPLDIHPAQWNERGGYPTLPSGADLTAREWARFGQLILQGGNWKGMQLVDPSALAENFTGSGVNAAYGLTWWLNEEPSADVLDASRTMTVASDLFTHPRHDELPGDLFMAAGAGGQRLYIIPSMEVVIVRQYPRVIERKFAQRRRGGAYSDVEFLLEFMKP